MLTIGWVPCQVSQSALQHSTLQDKIHTK